MNDAQDHVINVEVEKFIKNTKLSIPREWHILYPIKRNLSTEDFLLKLINAFFKCICDSSYFVLKCTLPCVLTKINKKETKIYEICWELTIEKSDQFLTLFPLSLNLLQIFFSLILFDPWQGFVFLNTRICLSLSLNPA